MASRNVSTKRGKNLSKALKIDEAGIRNHLNGVVKQTVEEPLPGRYARTMMSRLTSGNGMLDAEAEDQAHSVFGLL